jgi:hypothetical protein
LRRIRFYFTNSYHLVTFYNNMLMPNYLNMWIVPTNVISAFDKPCIPLKTCRKILFTSRNDHDKNMTKMYGIGFIFGCRQLFKIPSFVYMKEKFVTNISFATVRLINHSWNRIKCFASCFIIKYIFSTSFIHVGWEYLSLQSHKCHFSLWQALYPS